MKDKKNPLTPDEKKISRKGICLNTGRTHFKKGFTPWNAGKAGTYHHKKKRKFVAFTQERKDKASELAKELGLGKWMVGKKHSLATKSKMSKGRKGERNHFWRGGITSLGLIIRGSFEEENWRKQVFRRDNYTCQDCGDNSGGNLEAHHKKPFAKIFKEFLQEYNQFSPIEDKEILSRVAINYKPFWDIDNGKTLCNECHNLIQVGVRINEG